jgi:hypothetical protein
MDSPFDITEESSIKSSSKGKSDRSKSSQHTDIGKEKASEIVPESDILVDPVVEKEGMETKGVMEFPTKIEVENMNAAI